MANWASASYAIEGPKETLERIEKAILEHPVEEGSSEDWEGNVLMALGIDWEPNTPDGKGYYMRGFIRGDVEPWYTDDGTLRFDAEEAWGLTDFYEILEKNIPDIKVFYVVEESMGDVYATNDKEGKYFPDRFWVDTCVDGNYQSEYFQFESSVYKWLHDITDGRVKCGEDVDRFNDDYEDACDEDENFISIHKFEVMD